MRRFYEVIEQSAAHLYISAMPFAPKSSILSQTFIPKLEKIPRLISDAHTSASLVSLPAMKGAAGSTDGSLFVYSHDGMTLRIWDVVACISKGTSLIGHTAKVKCAKFSPDNKQIYSADVDGCIWVWDVQTCKPNQFVWMLLPFKFVM